MCNTTSQHETFERRKPRNGIGRINTMLDYAKSEYGCNFPTNFSSYLYEICYDNTIPSINVIDAIFKEWQYWKPYVLEEGFSAFMQHELKSIFKYQACSTISLSHYSTFVSRKGVILKNIPIPTQITAVNKNGKLTVNGRVVD